MLFKKIKLSEVSDIFSGYAFKSNDLKEDGIPVIRIANIQGKRVLKKCKVHLPKNLFTKKLERYVLQKKDCLVAMTGAGSVGKFGKMYGEGRDKYLVNQRVGIIRPNSEICCDKYIFQVLSLDAYEKQLYSLGLGAGQPNISAKEIGSLEIPLPELQDQRKIASILSAYDDLIENNLRRISILEEMARNLYREWFVKFRFPGHENVRFVDSELGRIPDGWENKKLKELIERHIGGGWGKENIDEKHTEWAWVIRGTDIPGARIGNITEVPFRCHTVSNLKSRKLAPGDIIFEVSGGSKGQPLGRTLLFTEELNREFNRDNVICASFCKKIRPDKSVMIPEILYLSLLDAYTNGEIEQYQVQSTGISNFKWTSYLENVYRTVPPMDIQNAFSDHVRYLFSHIGSMGRINNRLKVTRDLLLPKLISGEVDVSDLDIEFKDEVSA